MNRYPVSVVDNFLKDPQLVENLARMVEYELPKSHAPGTTSVKYINDLDPNLYQWITEKILGMWWDMRFNNLHWRCSVDFHKIPPLSDKELNSGLIHKDLAEIGNEFTPVELAGIIYLSKGSAENTGTSIFQEKTENRYGLLYNPYKEVAETIKDYNRESKDPVKFKSILHKHNAQFDEVIRVQNRYNRLFMYPANMWHGVTSYGEPGDQDRYTLRFFFHNIYDPQTHYPLERKDYQPNG